MQNFNHDNVKIFINPLGQSRWLQGAGKNVCKSPEELISLTENRFKNLFPGILFDPRENNENSDV